MSDSLCYVERPRDGVAVVVLRRADKRNALNIPLLESFCKRMENTNADMLNRVIILRGEGPVFCAGLDLQEAMEPENADRSAHLIAKALQSIYHSRCVTVAAVNGAAIAGGAGLMSACDFVVAADDAKFGYPEVFRGLVPGLVLTFLRRQVQERHVRELVLLGELIGAKRALEIGLVNRIVPAASVMDEALKLARQIMNGGPEALLRTKRQLDSLWPNELSVDLQRALSQHMQARNSDEAQEGIQAFLEKRKPVWQMGLDG